MNVVIKIEDLLVKLCVESLACGLFESDSVPSRSPSSEQRLLLVVALFIPAVHLIAVATRGSVEKSPADIVIVVGDREIRTIIV